MEFEIKSEPFRPVTLSLSYILNSMNAAFVTEFGEAFPKRLKIHFHLASFAFNFICFILKG